MLFDEFLHVPVKVLGRQLVKRSLVGAIEHRPERLDAVRVGQTSHVLGDRVVDRLVLEGKPKDALMEWVMDGVQV